tara:strand:+ start:80 stop:295 length:216 start_codon:yes stop_codon:yes gene_type:complete
MKERKVKITNIDQILRDQGVPTDIYNLCSGIKGLNKEIRELKYLIKMYQNLPTDDYTKEKIDTCNKEINEN